MRYPTKYVLVTDLDDTNSIWNINNRNNNTSNSNNLRSSSNLASNVINNNSNKNNCISGNNGSSSNKNINNLLVENTPLSQNSQHPNNNSNISNSNNNSSNNSSSSNMNNGASNNITASVTSNNNKVRNSSTKVLSFTAPLSNSVPDVPTNDLGNPLSMHIPLRSDIVLPERAWQDCVASDSSKLLAQPTASSSSRDDNNENVSGTANGLNSSDGICPNNNNCWEFGDPTQKYTCVCVR